MNTFNSCHSEHQIMIVFYNDRFLCLLYLFFIIFFGYCKMGKMGTTVNVYVSLTDRFQVSFSWNTELSLSSTK